MHKNFKLIKEDIELKKMVCKKITFDFLFDQVEQFWKYYAHIVRPSDLTGHSDYHLFKEGIRPMWEVSFLVSAGTCINTSYENDIKYQNLLYCMNYSLKI